MKTSIQLIAGVMLAVFSTLGGEPPETSQMIFRDYAALKWDKIVPELGDDSPQICILHVDPKTKASVVNPHADRNPCSPALAQRQRNSYDGSRHVDVRMRRRTAR